METSLQGNTAMINIIDNTNHYIEISSLQNDKENLLVQVSKLEADLANANRIEMDNLADKRGLYEHMTKLQDELNTIFKTEKSLRKENGNLESQIKTLIGNFIKLVMKSNDKGNHQQGNIDELKAANENMALIEKKNSSSQLKKVQPILLHR